MATVPDSHRDLLDAPVATLATVGADGRPQLSAVWFLAEGDNVRLSLNTARQKTKNLTARTRRRRCSSSTPPTRPDISNFAATPRSLRTTTMCSLIRLGAKYGGIDLRNMDQPGDSRVVVTIEPVRINAVDMSRIYR